MNFQRSGLSLHSYIWSQHGQDVLKLLRSLEKITEKLARWKNNSHYNWKCVHNNIVPKCFHLKSPVRGQLANNILRKAERRLLNVAVAQCQFTIRKLKEEKDQFWNKLVCEIDNEETVAAISKHLETIHEREFVTTKERQQRKFQQIKAAKRETADTEDNYIDKKRWVINISSHNINDAETSLLSKGLNFAMTPAKLPVEEYITATELACQQIEDTSKAAALRSDVTRILSKRRPHGRNIPQEEQKALESLARNKDIKILPADKGRVTVLMNTADYHSKLR